MWGSFSGVAECYQKGLRDKAKVVGQFSDEIIRAHASVPFLGTGSYSV